MKFLSAFFPQRLQQMIHQNLPREPKEVRGESAQPKGEKSRAGGQSHRRRGEVLSAHTGFPLHVYSYVHGLIP